MTTTWRVSFLVEVRAMCKPVACFDLPMLSKQLSYIRLPPSSEPESEGRGRRCRALGTVFFQYVI